MKSKFMYEIGYHWCVDTNSLFDQIIKLPEGGFLRADIQMVKHLLSQIAEESICISDPTLMRLVIKLGLFSFSDPKDPDFNPEFIRDYLTNIPS